MKVLNRLTFDNLITNGEVDEGLPLYNKFIDNFYKLNGNFESYYPDILIKDKVYIVNDDESLLKTFSNINTTQNGNMVFPTDKNAFIEVDRSLAETNRFEFQIKIKINDFSNPNYKILSIKNTNNKNDNVEFELYLKSDSRRLHLYYPNDERNGDRFIKTIYDEPNIYYMSGAGDLNKDMWYTIKLIKYDNIVSVYINNRLCKTIFNNKKIVPTNFYVGAFSNSLLGTFKSGEKKVLEFDTTNKSINGEVEFISFRKFVDQKEINIPIKAENGFSACHKINFDLIAIKDLLSIDNLKFLTRNNDAIFIKDNNIIGKFLLEENKDYFVSYTYNNENRNIYIYVYNMTDKKELLNINTFILLTKMSVVNCEELYDLTIYNKSLTLDNLKRNINTFISINQTCNLYNDIEEQYDSFKLNPGVNGSRYFLPLSNNFNSLDGTINNNIQGQFLNVGCRSGVYKSDNLYNFIKYSSVSKPNQNYIWNKKLHEDAIVLNGWTPGYNEGVENPEVGYHAKFVYEGSNNNPCIKMINYNKEFNNQNRWMGVCKYLQTFYSTCKIGDNLKIIIKAKSDKPCKIQIGFYSYRLSTGKTSFGPNIGSVFIKDSNWGTYMYETNIDSDWDLTKRADVYFYSGFTNNSTVWIDDIFIIQNGKKVDISLLENNIDAKIKIPFGQQINLDYTKDFSLVYQKKIINLDEGKSFDSMGENKGLYWGIDNDNLIIGYGDKKITTNIDSNDYINKWLTIGLVKNNDKITFYIYGKGIEKNISIENNGLNIDMLYNSTLRYDLMLGGKNNQNYGCSLYKNLNILKNCSLSSNSILDYYKTKMSFKKNKLLTNIEIVESII